MEPSNGKPRRSPMTEGLPNTLLPTTLVGSYPQPDWLIDRRLLAEIVPPRPRARELWRVEAAWLDQAQDDATLLAIRDQERAGIDVVTDGEMRRESYSNRFATALDGMDSERLHRLPAADRADHPRHDLETAGRARGNLRRVLAQSFPARPITLINP